MVPVSSAQGRAPSTGACGARVDPPAHQRAGLRSLPSRHRRDRAGRGLPVSGWLPGSLLVAFVAAPALASTWTSVAPMPEPRWFHTPGVGLDGRLYVYGGEVRPDRRSNQHGVGIFALVIYDPGSGAWSRGPELSSIPMRGYERHVVDRIDKSGVMERTVVGKEVSSAERVHHEVQAGRADPAGKPRWYGVSYWIPFDPLARAWGEVEAAVTAPDLEPQGGPPVEARWIATGPSLFRFTPTTATSKNLVYITGGLARPYRDRSARPMPSASMEVGDAATDAWRELSPMRTTRYLHAATIDRRGRLFASVDV